MSVDAAVGAHGAEDRVASEFHVVDCFDEGVETGVEIFAPLEEKAGGAGVPVEGAIVGEIVVLSELPGGAPVEEFLFALSLRAILRVVFLLAVFLLALGVVVI